MRDCCCYAHVKMMILQMIFFFLSEEVVTFVQPTTFWQSLTAYILLLYRYYPSTLWSLRPCGLCCHTLTALWPRSHKGTTCVLVHALNISSEPSVVLQVTFITTGSTPWRCDLITVLPDNLEVWHTDVSRQYAIAPLDRWHNVRRSTLLAVPLNQKVIWWRCG